MKPKRIFLVRHGESEGNVDKTIYTKKPDYAYELTERGREQAHQVGELLADAFGDKSIQFYCSPYWRTRQTYLEILKEFNRVRKLPLNYLVNRGPHCYEDPRLREQEWGTSFKTRNDNTEEERDSFGHFYYRIESGESCADVYDRVSDFLNTLWRDFEKENYAENVIIVTHGMTMRLFLMRWFHWTVEEFEKLANPKNCGFYELTLHHTGKYFLAGTPATYAKYSHDFQFKWV